ncbi:MAG TPA: YncE family protein [Candidatus Eisenbacteria bacterium]|nr:YncE family protein [Candidatus Eisenbacteria bacterium]
MKRILAFVLALSAMATVPAAAQKSYKLAERVKLGGEGGWDYLVYDSDANRLFITRGSHVMVVDAKTLKTTGDITGLSGVHGVALAPALGRGYITSGGDDMLVIFDLKSLKVLDKVRVGERPDAVLYEATSKRVYTFNARSQDSTVVDAASGKVVGTVPLGGKPETGVADGKGKVFVNIEDRSEIVRIDTAKLTVAEHFPMAGCDEPSALVMDVAHRRLFAGCASKIVAIVDPDSGQLLTTVDIGAGVDAGAFNPKTQQIFMSCGSDGVLSVIQEDSPNKYSVVQTVPTARGARTMTLDTASNTIYTVTAQFDPAPPPPGQRRKILPDTFELLVVRPE